MSIESIFLHSTEQILFIAKEKLILDKNYRLDMESPCSFLPIHHRESLRPARSTYIVGIKPAHTEVLYSNKLFFIKLMLRPTLFNRGGRKPSILPLWRLCHYLLSVLGLLRITPTIRDHIKAFRGGYQLGSICA